MRKIRASNQRVLPERLDLAEGYVQQGVRSVCSCVQEFVRNGLFCAVSVAMFDLLCVQTKRDVSTIAE